MLLHQAIPATVGAGRKKEKLYRYIAICWILLAGAHGAQAQYDSLQFQLELKEDSKELRSLLRGKLEPVGSVAIRPLLRQVLQQVHEAGYLRAKVGEVYCEDSLCYCPLLAGAKFRWASLENGNLPDEMLEAIDFKARFYEEKQFNYKTVARLENKLLDYCENNGYPFAQVWLDSLTSDSNHLSARIYLDYGPLITLDEISIEAKKNAKKPPNISKKYLYNYLGLKPGSLYEEAQILKIKKRLRELPFINSYRDPVIIFLGDKAQPVLFLDNQRASKFDILFGLLPNANAGPQEPQFKFTGNVNVDLYNPFGTGKRLMAKWQQFEQGRSELRLAFAFPYLLNSPLGLDVKFDIYRRDSTYIDIISDVGLQYLFDGNNYLKAFWKNTTTNVQNIDTLRVLTTRELPSILDLRNTVFGLEYYFQRLNYRWNPTQGFELKAIAGFGIKRIRENSAILGLRDPADPAFDFESLYDSVGRRSFQYTLEVDYAHFLPLWKSTTLMGRYRTGWIYSSQQQIYTNELYRLGGYQIMRGFDEQSIFASWYNVFTTELRYLLGTNSYAYLFGDLSYAEERSVEIDQQAWRYGFGVGVALETPVGIFGLSYALGAVFDNPLILRNGKVHFGYVNIF